MSIATTIRVSQRARDDLRRLADDDHMSLDEVISSLVRAERRGCRGRALAGAAPDADERAWLGGRTEVGTEAVRLDASR